MPPIGGLNSDQFSRTALNKRVGISAIKKEVIVECQQRVKPKHER